MTISRLIIRTGTRTALALIALISTGTLALGQQVDEDIEPWRLVRVFIEQTGSPREKVDREAFRARLAGELAERDLEAEIAGTWRRYVDVRIDTVVPLPPTVVTREPSEVDAAPRSDTLERVAVLATTYIDGNYDNSSFFLEHDSIWRITHLRSFPTDRQRVAITDRASAIDTTLENFMLSVRNEFVLLESDRDLARRFNEMILDDARGLARHLARSSAWNELLLGPLDAESIDPWFALDDSITSSESLIHSLNHNALDRLFRAGVTRIVRVQEGILFEIGRLEESSAGYLFGDTTQSLPTMAPDHYFSLSPLPSGWWLYRRSGLPGPRTGEGVALIDLRKMLEPAAVRDPEPEESVKEGLLIEKE